MSSTACPYASAIVLDGHVAEVRREQRIFEAAQWMVDGQRLSSNTSSPAPAMTLRRRASISACSSTTGPRAVLMRNAVGFINASSRSADDAACPVAEHEMNGYHVGALKKDVLCRRAPTPSASVASRVKILTPRDDLHAERLADRATSVPRRPRPMTPSVFPCSPTPTVVCHAPVRIARRLARDVAGEREDQPPRELHRRRRERARPAHDHAARRCLTSIAAFRRPVVTRSFSAGKAFEERGRKWRALAHRDDHVDVAEALGDRRPLCPSARATVGWTRRGQAPTSRPSTAPRFGSHRESRPE